MDYEIRKVKEHYEIYLDGTFMCSCDTKREMEEEIKELLL